MVMSCIARGNFGLPSLNRIYRSSRYTRIRATMGSGDLVSAKQDIVIDLTTSSVEEEDAAMENAHDDHGERKRQRDGDTTGNPCTSNRHKQQGKEESEKKHTHTRDDTTTTFNTCMLPFQLLKTRGIPREYQEGPVGFDIVQHVSGDIKVAFVSNYMMDIPWLVDTCPDLFFSDMVVLVHGQQGASEGMKRQLGMLGVESAEVVCPYVPPYGTHHTKAFFLQYERGIRIIIHTANLLYCDVNNKSQSAFLQDFPRKKPGQHHSASDFEKQLVGYVERLGLGRVLEDTMKKVISMHDYTYARGHIVSSVPSKPFEFEHQERAGQYGHARVASILKNEIFDASYARAPILAQFSSIGNISDKFMREIRESFSSGQFAAAGHASSSSSSSSSFAEMELVWPTVSEVRDSLEGFFGGGSLCGYPNRFQKSTVMDRIHRWGGQVAGRQRALPHMKTYLRYSTADNDVRMPWVLLASHNFSKAAWGEYVQSRKYNTKLFRILSYEMGILLVPRLELAYRNSPQCGFSCTTSSTTTSTATIARERKRIEAVEFVPWKKGITESMDGTTLRVPIPLPFELPPVPYPTTTTTTATTRDPYRGSQSYDSTPWTVTPDPTHGNVWHGIDALGNPYPGKGSYQGVLQRDTDEDIWYRLFSSP